MPSTQLLLVAGFFLVGVVSLRAADSPKMVEPERLKLWNMHAPIGDGTFEKA
jgi:hypothetical protein